MLPLENLSGDPAQEYFADRMTEALISNLAQIRALKRVISRTSVMRYDENLLGHHHLRTNEDDLRRAIGHFDCAIQLAPDYAAAFAGLSNAWERRGIFGAKNLKEVVSLARDAAVTAVALDPQLADAHLALGFVKTHDWDWAGAERDITRALELDPNSAEAHRAYADLLMQLERHDEAIREIQRSEELDPFSSNIQSRYGRVLYRARKYEEAVAHLQQAIDLDPNPGNSMPYWILGELYAQMGRYDEAIDSFKRAKANGGRALSLSAEIAGVYARMGNQNEARRMLAELKAATDAASFSDASVAHAYTALGDMDEAIKVLSAWLGSGTTWLPLSSQIRRSQACIPTRVGKSCWAS